MIYILKAFENEAVDSSCHVYKMFNAFGEKTDMTMMEYLLEFEHLNHKLLEHNMILPDISLAFKLLDSADLSEDKNQLPLTLGAHLKFVTMKGALKRIFGNDIKKDRNTYIIVKTDSDVFYNYKTKDRYSGRYGENSSINPIGKDGKTTRCVVCNSNTH